VAAQATLIVPDLSLLVQRESRGLCHARPPSVRDAQPWHVREGVLVVSTECVCEREQHTEFRR
jgi:hypothetical protein